MNLDDQPYEIHLHIFSFLDDKDIYSISQLNPYYRQIANEFSKDRLIKRNIRISKKKNTNYAKLLPVSIDKNNLLISYIHDDYVILRHLIANHIKPDINHIWIYIIKYDSVNIMKHFIQIKVFSNEIIAYHIGRRYYDLANCSVQLFQLIDDVININYTYLFALCINSNNISLAEYISTKVSDDKRSYGLTHIIKLCYEKQYYNLITNICKRKENYDSCSAVISVLLTDDCVDIVNLIMTVVDIDVIDILRHRLDIKIVQFFINKKHIILKYIISEKHYDRYDIFELILDSDNELVTENVISDIVSNASNDKLFRLLITKGYNVRFDNDKIFNDLFISYGRYDLCNFMIDKNIGLCSDSVRAYVIRDLIVKADLKGIDILLRLGVVIEYV